MAVESRGGSFQPLRFVFIWYNCFCIGYNFNATSFPFTDTDRPTPHPPSHHPLLNHSLHPSPLPLAHTQTP
ncbi:hypothetical protein L2E82_50894 [Cichorium intybus]|nr:hypothetical protein L2E82_50894 [Cichorium intybus]